MKNDAQIAILVDARSREAIRVHSQAGGFDVAGNAVEVDRRQAGLEQAIAGDDAIEQITDYLLLGQTCKVFRFQFLPGAFQVSLKALAHHPIWYIPG